MQHILLLRPLDIEEHSVQPEHTLLQRGRLLRDLTRLRRWLSSRLALHHNVKVQELLGQSGHVVFKTEAVFSNGVGCEDVVALSFPYAVEEDFVIGVFHLKVYIE